MMMPCVGKPRRRRRRPAVEPPPGLLERLDGLLPRDALEDALAGLGPEEITGPGGLLTQLARRVIETALGAELSEHLGHPPGGVLVAANVRNRQTSKTLQTELGPVRIRTPRDRDASFQPRLVAKRQTRLLAWMTACSTSMPAACRCATSLRI